MPKQIRGEPACQFVSCSPCPRFPVLSFSLFKCWLAHWPPRAQLSDIQEVLIQRRCQRASFFKSSEYDLEKKEKKWRRFFLLMLMLFYCPSFLVLAKECWNVWREKSNFDLCLCWRVFLILFCPSFLVLAKECCNKNEKPIYYISFKRNERLLWGLTDSVLCYKRVGLF